MSWRRALPVWPALRARTHVFLVVLACIVPMLGVSAFAIKTLADSERERDKTQAMSTARALSAAVDLKLETGAAALATLSTFQALPVADLKPFYDRCAETARQNNAWIVLADTSGEPIFNTRAPLGTPLPRLNMASLVEQAARTRTVEVSGIAKGSLTGQLQVSVLFPIVRQGQVTHVLVMSFQPDEIARVLVDQNLPESWRVVVVDREHRVIARNRALHEFDAAPVAPALAEHLKRAREASFTGLDRLGNDLMSTFTTSAYSGWALVVGFPVAEMTAPLYRSLLGLGLAAGGMLLLGIVLAAVIGSRLNRSMGRLSSSAMALALGGEMPLTPAKTKVAEINDVMASLGRASEQLLERSRQRNQAEAALLESEQRFRDIAAVSGDSIWEMGPDLRFTSFRGYFDGRLIVDPPAIIGKTRWEVAGADPEQDESWRQHKIDLEAHRLFRQFRTVSKLNGQPNGRRVFLSISGAPWFDEFGEFAGYRGTATDETAIVEAREQIDRAEALLRDAVESTSEGFAIFDAQDRLVLFNDRTREVYADPLHHMRPGATFEEMLRASVAKGIFADAHGREEEWIVERLKQHREASGTIEQRLSNGRWLLVTERRMRNGGIATTRLDITALKEEQAARRELEQQLQHSQKLEALGVLAGGIAHDLNNTLVPIFVTAKLGIKHAAEDGRMRQRFELIYDAGVRARDLIKRILAFSRKDTIHRQGFRLDRILSDDLEMLRHSISTTIAIEADIQPVPEIFGDPDQMRQVVVNLVNNAVHAIGGDLGTVAVSLIPVAEGAADEKPIIRLMVRDTGCGMDEATKRRIFEPFFTTKPVGEGTGLGLSMVHGIVTSLSGTIRVESEPGKGTCFTIELPPMTAPAECVPAREEVAA